MAEGRYGTKRGAHLRSSTRSEDRLRGLAELLPRSGGLGSRRSVPTFGASMGAGLGRYVVALVVVLVIVFVAVQWLRPLPGATAHVTESGTLRLPGASPSLPWPAEGAAAMSEVGVGSLGHSGTTNPLPIASIAKVLAVDVVLQDHPLSLGNDGPTIPVTPDVVSDYRAGLASQQSEVPVTPGESMTELQALEGLLVASGNDIAALVADWDAGGSTGFIAKMNALAGRLGLSSVRVTDPSGLDQGTVGDVGDLIKLGEFSMQNSVFTQIVAMPQVTLPGAGTVYNYDYALGHDGIVGIKTGSDTAAGGNFLFEAAVPIAGQKVTLVGAILDQKQGSPIITALHEAEALVAAAASSARPIALLAPGQQVGTVTTPWGGSVPVVATSTPTVVSWPGLNLEARVRLGKLGSSFDRGAKVGDLVVSSPGRTYDVPLRSAGALNGPGLTWRLTRF